MIKNIFSSLNDYAGGFVLISKLQLWRYFFIPMVISLVVGIMITIFAYGLSDNIGQFIARIWIWEFGKETFTLISEILGGLTIILIGVILFKYIILALSAPFMSPVSEKIEAHFYDPQVEYRNTNFSQQLWRGIRINVRNLFMELFITILILLFSLIPVIGWITSVLLIFTQAYYAGFGNMDYTLERHYDYQHSVAFVRKNRGTAIGNGLVFILLLLIPVIGVLLVLPLTVTAASVSTVKLLNKSRTVDHNRL